MQSHPQDNRQRTLISTFKLRVLMYIFPAQYTWLLFFQVLGLTEFTKHFKKSTFSETNWPILPSWKLMQTSDATLTHIIKQYFFKTRACNQRVLLSLNLSSRHFPYSHHFPLQHAHKFTESPRLLVLHKQEEPRPSRINAPGRVSCEEQRNAPSKIPGIAPEVAI